MSGPILANILAVNLNGLVLMGWTFTVRMWLFKMSQI